MKKFYYEVCIETAEESTPIGVKSEKELSEQEAINIALLNGGFVNTKNQLCIDSHLSIGSVQEITEEEFTNNDY